MVLLCIFGCFFWLFSIKKYLDGYKLLEDGLKTNGTVRKIYPWGRFEGFDVDIQKKVITLKCASGKVIALRISKLEFDEKLPAIEIFLREKISFKNIPGSS